MHCACQVLGSDGVELGLLLKNFKDSRLTFFRGFEHDER